MIYLKENFYKSIPNIITLSNLALGFYSLKLTFQGDYNLAVAAIIACMFLDCLDGKAARKLNVVSDFGKELDSLSDMVSFGAAPAFLAWTILPFETGWSGMVFILFLICGACRLAKFNSKDSDHLHFLGFPITAAGGLLAIASLYFEIFSPVLFSLFVFVISISMVSNIPFYSLKKISQFKKVIVVSICLLFIMSLFLPFVIVLLIGLYYLSGLVSCLFSTLKNSSI